MHSPNCKDLFSIPLRFNLAIISAVWITCDRKSFCGVVHYCQYWEGFQISPSLRHFLKSPFRLLTFFLGILVSASHQLRGETEAKRKKWRLGGRRLFRIAPGFHPLSSRFSFVYCGDTENQRSLRLVIFIKPLGWEIWVYE